MLCRVCKRELGESSVCSFCGEDNTPYIQAMKEESPKKEIKEEKASLPKSKKTAKVKSKYKINPKKLARSVIVLALTTLALILVVNIFSSKDDKKAVPTGETLFSSGMLTVGANGEWGYVNIKDSSIFAIEPQFTHVTNYHGDVAAVCIDGKFALIDKTGTLLCEPVFQSVGEFSDNGYIAVEENGKWGYVDDLAQYIIEPKFATAGGFAKNKMAPVSVSGSYGFIGEDGEYTIAPQYDMALSFAENGLAAVKTDGKWGYIDETGSAVIEPRFEEAYGFENGYAVIKRYGDYGLIDAEGKTVITPQFDERFYFKGEYAKVKTGNKYGVIDINGTYKVNPRYTDMGTFSEEGLCYAMRGDGKYGFIDINDKFVIKPSYEGAGNFSMGLAPVKKDGLWGYVDTEGNEVIEPKYLSASEFYADGYAFVTSIDGGITIINTEGKMAMLESASPIDNILK